MMGFGTIGSGGGGNSSSSTSNLSALAPPFTVDRLNPKPSTNPLLHYSESPYVAEPFSHPWQYAPPSAPRPETVIDSPGLSSVPVSDGYQFSASASISSSSAQWSAPNSGTQATGSAFGYGGEVNSYYSPYVPPLVGEDSLLVEDEGCRSRYNVVPTSGLSATSQHDYTQSLFDLEYGPRWVDSLGFDDGKRAKRSELDGSFSSEKANVGGSHSYINQLYQGGHISENWNKSKEDSGVFYQSLNQVSDREIHTGSSSTERTEDKSCLEQNLGFIPYNSNRTLVTASSSPYPESYPSVISCEMQKNFPHYQNSCIPYEKCVRHVDAPFPGRASVIRASPAVVIRPPPATNSNLGQGIASRKPACSENVGGVNSVDFDYTNPLKLKDSGSQSSSKIKEESFETNLFNFSKQGNGFISSTSVKELSSPLHSRDTSDRKIKARFGSQLPDINVSSGFAMAGDNVPVFNSTEDSSDIIDHHNTAVDSPCWKGAPSSQFLTFDIEAGNSKHAKVNLDEHYEFGREEHKNFHSMVDSDRVFSEKVESNMGKGNECARNGVALALERTLNAICSTKEQSLFDGAKDTVWTSPMTRSKGVELSDGPNMLNKESNLLNNLTSVFDMKASDSKHLIGEEGTGMTVNDVSEGAAVAVHAAEKVLASPASQEDATEHTVVPDSKLNVSAMIKTIHNLSELLRFHLSSDAFSLEEDNMEILKHVISNLDSCLCKKVVPATSKPEPNNDHVGDTSEILGESRNVGTISGGPHMKSEAANSDKKFNYLHMHEEERNYSFPGKKDEKSPIFSPLRDDIDITGNDDMTKAIKKVLEENFQLNDEMHSQALLFKSLWLEAEAKLCSISYKARFDRMKIQMEEIKRKPLQENEDIAEMTSPVSISPYPITISELASKACDGTSPKPTSQNVSISSTSGHADDVEASVLARFNILKSREVNLRPINTEEEQQPEVVDGDAGSIMARYNILKSREENSSIVMDEEKQPKMINGDAGSVMDRFNIMKSREEKSKSISMDEEKQPKMIDGEFAGEKYLPTYIRGQLEDETVIVDQKPHLLYRTGNINDRKLDSYGDVAGYESFNEYHLSITNDPIIHPFKSSMMIDGNNSGSRDSSSSDWEHVLKDDFSWKNL